jgi:hypothetical protein
MKSRSRRGAVDRALVETLETISGEAQSQDSLNIIRDWYHANIEGSQARGSQELMDSKLLLEVFLERIFSAVSLVVVFKKKANHANK